MAALAEKLPAALVERGIEVAFAVPGKSTVCFYRGLAGSGLRLVTARTEMAAGFMADGYARATGKPAAVFVASGPGMNGLSLALRTALNASTPMLALCIVDSAERAGLADPEAAPPAADPAVQPDADPDADHDADPAVGAPAGTPARPFAIITRKPTEARGVFEALDDAIDVFATRRPGPVCVDIPREVMAAEAGHVVSVPRPTAEAEPATAAELAEIVMRLDSARRPLVIFGGGALDLEPQAATALVETLKASAILTSNARGLLPAQHPQLVRAPLTTAPVQELITRADAVLALGVGFSAREWGAKHEFARFADDALIRVDIDEGRLALPPRAAYSLARAAAPTVQQLMLSLAPHEGAAPDAAPVAQAAAATIPHRLGRHRALLDAVWEHLPTALLIGDVTEPAQLGVLNLVAPGPRRWWSSASGYGAPGYALPAAIGAKIGQPRRPVVALVGDKAAPYTLAELASANDARAPVIMVVWNNNGDSEMREALLAARLRPEDFATGSVDFQALARGYGAHFQRVNGQAFFREALRGAMARQTATLLEVREEFWFGG